MKLNEFEMCLDQHLMQGQPCQQSDKDDQRAVLNELNQSMQQQSKTLRCQNETHEQTISQLKEEVALAD